MARNTETETVVYINGKKSKAKVDRTRRKITVTVAGTSTKLSAVTSDGSSINLTADGVLIVKRGTQVLTSTSGFDAYSNVESWCYSSPIKLGTETANGIGETNARYEITSVIPSGDHRLVVRGENSQQQSVTIGFAMRVIDESRFLRITKSPVVWAILPIALLTALFLPSRIRRRHKEAR